MSAQDTLAVLLDGPGRRDCLIHVHTTPARHGRTADWPSWADQGVVDAYRAIGVERPWQHQATAANALWRGEHTVISTSTGSGKSLAAWLPALSAVQDSLAEASVSRGSIAALRRRPTTLYLSPTKALAADQRSGLDRLLHAGGVRNVRVAPCDGDTPLEERDWAREHADIVLSNPDFLHFSMLPGHRRWARMLRALKFVVVDECHAYRGVLGAHVALVLRRLLRLAEHYGATPTVLLASATTAEPEVTAARLIGVESSTVRAVTEDASPRGRRTLALWQPPVLADGDDAAAGASTGASGWGELASQWGESPEPVPAAPPPARHGPVVGSQLEGPRRSALSEAALLLTDLVAADLRALAFVRSRVGAEAVAAQTRERLADRGHAGVVAAYRGGYLPEERRDLERALRSGALRALATTNALELGVDISGLDAVLMAGWPGTRVSLWQQAGRAGRAGTEGLAVLIASENPLDTYLVHHPEAIVDEPVESTTFDPSNPYVLAPHLCAAAAEAPLTELDLARFGMTDTTLLAELTRRGLLRRRPAGWYWNHARSERPHQLTDLRGSGGDGPLPLVEASTGRVLGTVDGARADSMAHQGAVYLHQGATFEVIGLTDDAALVEAGVIGHRTTARSQSHVEIVATRREHQWGQVVWGFGDVEVTSQVVGYEVRRPPTMEVIGSHSLDMPVRTLRTRAAWWSVPVTVLAEAGVASSDVAGALHAAEHAAIGLLPLLATCDRWDVGGLSTAVHAQTLAPTVFVYDGYPGGAGFAERGFALASRWIAATAEAIAECACAQGCPRCVYSPKCGNGNSPLHKRGALTTLRVLLASAPSASAPTLR